MSPKLIYICCLSSSQCTLLWRAWLHLLTDFSDVVRTAAVTIVVKYLLEAEDVQLPFPHMASAPAHTVLMVCSEILFSLKAFLYWVNKYGHFSAYRNSESLLS